MTGRLYLKDVEMSDADLILDWVNDPLDRANSFSSDLITREEHIAWLEKALVDPSMRLYIMMLDDQRVGHIKLKIDGEVAEIGYCVAPEWRGMGFAKAITALIVREVNESLPEVKTLIAQVKPTNVASARALESNGYRQTLLQYEFALDSLAEMQGSLNSAVNSAEERAR